MLEVREPSELVAALLRILLGDALSLLSAPAFSLLWAGCSAALAWLARLERDQSLTSC